jgi:hypothetical protein
MGWLLIHFNFLDISKKADFLGLFLIFIVETIISLGWAHLIFRVFIEGEGSLKDVWFGIKKYLPKAMGASIISSFVIALAVLNIRFYFCLNSPHRFMDFLCVGFIFWALIFWLLSSAYYWPILFFQNPPFFKIFYKSFLLAFENLFVSSGMLIIYFIFAILFSIVWPLWFFIGGVFLFSLQCVVLEKQLLMYKITYGNMLLDDFLKTLDHERQRDWREFLKPWENR